MRVQNWWDQDKHMYGPVIHTVLLERFRFLAHKIIPDDVLMRTDVRVVHDEALRSLVFYLEGEFYGEHLDRQRVSYPRDWWEHMREALYVWLGHGWDGFGHWPWFGDYCRKRWPIQYRTVEIDVRALYPSIRGETNYVRVVIKTEVE